MLGFAEPLQIATLVDGVIVLTLAGAKIMKIPRMIATPINEEFAVRTLGRILRHGPGPLRGRRASMLAWYDFAAER